MGNSAFSCNTLLSRATGALAARLPKGWRVSLLKAEPKRATYQPDALLTVRAPDGTTARVAVEAKRALTAATAVALAPRINQAARENNAAPLVVADYLSPTARERLRAADVSYLDLTGNIRIVLARPGLFVDDRGADRDPAPTRAGIRSLKGGAAARIVRALCDWRPPTGVRELAQRAETNAGYTSRILSLLEQEDVVGRDRNGRVTTVKWQDLIRRWTQDYAVARTNPSELFLDPRGADAFVSRLRSYAGQCAITGSRAVPPGATVAPARTISCYVSSIDKASRALDLRPVDAGGNVLLLEPFDRVVWVRTRNEDSLPLVALSQCAADLMTGTAREPAESEALLRWMEKNESAWRA